MDESRRNLVLHGPAKLRKCAAGLSIRCASEAEHQLAIVTAQDRLEVKCKSCGCITFIEVENANEVLARPLK